jgi:acetyl esterase/lipase
MTSTLSESGDDGSEATRVAAPRMAPRLEALWQRVQAEDAGLPDITTLAPSRGRRQFDDIAARWNRLERGRYHLEPLQLPAPPRARHVAGEGMAALRVESTIGAQRGAGTIVFLHGGGWVFGNLQTHRGAMARLADACGCTVIGIDYGLAPEAPFPSGLNDCVWAWRWLRSQANDDLAPWFIAGDSAGANLALSTMIELRDAGEALPDAGLLFYGVYSADHGTPSHRRCGDGSFGLSSAKMAWYRAHYLAGGRGHPDDPRVSPLHADVKGLPPLLVTGAELDPLFDDSTALAAKLATADARFEFRRYVGMNHGFMQMGSELPEARQAFRDAAVFLSAALNRSIRPMETTR